MRKGKRTLPMARKDERDKVLDELISKLDNPATHELDCNTTDAWYGFGWEDCRVNLIKYLKELRQAGEP